MGRCPASSRSTAARKARRAPTFNPVIQYFVHRGYAVLAPNVRGSIGYGREYTHLDDVRGRMDSVHDLAAAVDWLRGSGQVDARRASPSWAAAMAAS